jgi:hypothetical protein
MPKILLGAARPNNPKLLNQVQRRQLIETKKRAVKSLENLTN